MGRQEKLKQLRREEEQRKSEKKRKIRRAIFFFSILAIVSIAAGTGGFYIYQKVTYKPKTYKIGDRKYSQYPDMQVYQNKQYFATLETDFGKIKIKLNAKDAQRTVNNFVALSRDGFYDGLTFHRVVKDFIIQGGDPKGDGSGDPGYKFDDEKPPQKEYKRGIVAMANSGENTNGSQFFIMHKDKLDLPANYTIFGEVIEGIETVDKIAEVEVTEGPSGEKSVPTKKIEIKKVTIEEK